MPKEIPCKVCGKIWTKQDVKQGKAVIVNKTVYCAEHDPRKRRKRASEGQIPVAQDAEEDMYVPKKSKTAVIAVMAGIIVLLGAVAVLLVMNKDTKPEQSSADTKQEQPDLVEEEQTGSQEHDSTGAKNTSEEDSRTDDAEQEQPGQASDSPDRDAEETVETADEPAKEIDPELKRSIASIDTFLEQAKIKDAALVLEEIEKKYTGPREKKLIEDTAQRVKKISDELFYNNINEAQKYLKNGQVKTALEFLREIKTLVMYPGQERARKDLLNKISSGGTDPRSLEAQSLFYKALKLSEEGNAEQAYEMMNRVGSSFMDTVFYKKMKPVIGEHLSNLKIQQLSEKGGELGYFEDFEKGFGEWEGGVEPKNKEILEGGAIQLGFKPRNKHYSNIALVRKYGNKGLFTCASARGYLLMRYYIDIPVKMTIRMSNKTQNDNFDYRLKKPVPGMWKWFKVSFEDFEDAAHKDKKIAKSDVITRIQISAGPPGVKVMCLIDEVAVVFGEVPSLYKDALRDEKEEVTDYTLEGEEDFASFNTDVMRTILTMKRENVKEKSIYIYGDEVAEKIKISGNGITPANGYSVEYGEFTAEKGHSVLYEQFTKELDGLTYTPEIAVIAAGYKELTKLSRELYMAEKKREKFPKFGLEPQHGGFSGWWIWRDPKGNVDFKEARNRGITYQVPTEGEDNKGMPIKCNCPQYKSKQTCIHVEYLADRWQQKVGRKKYRPNVKAAYDKIITTLISRGVIPVMVTPPLVPDRFSVLSEWNADYVNAVIESSNEHNVPFVTVFHMLAKSENNRRLRGGRTGLSSMGYERLNRIMLKLYRLIEQYCLDRNNDAQSGK